MTILVVEDNAFVRFVLLELLQELGWVAVGVEHGQAALAYLQTAAKPVGLILLDLMMPTMDGWALCATLRRDPALATIPIVVMSARTDLADQAAQVGAVAYLTKPFEQEAVQAIVERYHLSSSRSREA